MTEENQDQQNTANNMQAGTQKEETIKEVPTLTSFIKQEIPQIKEMEENYRKEIQHVHLHQRRTYAL